MDNIIRFFFWDYEGESFFDYVFLNYRDWLHFDINPTVLAWFVALAMALSVIRTIKLLNMRKVNPKVSQDEEAKKKWRRDLIISLCIIFVGIILFWS